jgi:hypothetical protein
VQRCLVRDLAIMACPGEALLMVSPSNHTDQCASTWPITRIA